MSKPVTIGTNVVVPLPSRRQPPGPAQHDWLIHFCGRPPGSKMTPSVPAWIAQQAASERLNNILGSGTLYGFPPHGAKQPGGYLLETPPPWETPGFIPPLPPERWHLLAVHGGGHCQAPGCISCWSSLWRSCRRARARVGPIPPGGIPATWAASA
jgi:hypothetical protein